MIIIFETPNKNGMYEHTRAELEELLYNAWNEGFAASRNKENNVSMNPYRFYYEGKKC